MKKPKYSLEGRHLPTACAKFECSECGRLWLVSGSEMIALLDTTLAAIICSKCRQEKWKELAFRRWDALYPQLLEAQTNN